MDRPRSIWHEFGSISFTIVLFLLAPAGQAEPPESDADADPPATDTIEEAEEVRAIGSSPDDIDAQLTEAEEGVKPLIDVALLGAAKDLWNVGAGWLRDELDLRIGLYYTALYQHATRAAGPNDAFGGEMQLVGRWGVVDFEDHWPIAIAGSLEWRHQMASRTPNNLGNKVRGLYGTTIGFDSHNPAITQLYVEGGSFAEGFQARMGKIDPALIWDGGRYVSQRTGFHSPAFSDTPAMPLPSPGLGAAAVAYPTHDLYVTVGIHDANARRTGNGSTIDRKDFFYAAEVGWTPRFGEPDEGRFTLTGWYKDRSGRTGQSSGQGLAVTLEPALGETGRFRPFVRYSFGDGGAMATKHNLAGGLGIEQLWGLPEDLLALSAGWSRSRRGTERDQYVLEAFYRLPLTPLITMTPDVQMIVNPSRRPSRDVVWVFSLRLRTVF